VATRPAVLAGSVQTVSVAMAGLAATASCRLETVAAAAPRPMPYRRMSSEGQAIQVRRPLRLRATLPLLLPWAALAVRYSSGVMAVMAGLAAMAARRRVALAEPAAKRPAAMAAMSRSMRDMKTSS
jgi:hypothetical protein